MKRLKKIVFTILKMMIDTIETWKAPKEVALAIIDLALAHIKKVEANPEVKTEGDNFDYWNSYELEDGTYIDYNIYCGDDVGEFTDDGDYKYGDPSKWTWSASCYAVDPPTKDNPYHQINTDHEHYLFSYENGKIVFED
jgi:hypothetical protein